MKAICYTILKTLEEYDDELANLGRPSGKKERVNTLFWLWILFAALEYFLPEDKRKGPDHVFLRWECYPLTKLKCFFLDLAESCNPLAKLHPGQNVLNVNNWTTIFLIIKNIVIDYV